MLKNFSIKRRVDLYKDSSCIEEYCVKRDLQLPSFRWKLFDSIVFCCKHGDLCQAVWDNDNAFPFVVIGFCVGGVLTALCSYFFDCDFLLFVFSVSALVSATLAMVFFIMMCNVCFELGILRICKK